MKSFAAKCVMMCVLAGLLLLLCSILAVNDHGGPLFLATAGVCVIILGSLSDSVIPSRDEHRLWLSLARGIGVGALVGLGAWVVMMSLVSVLSDPGDKFGVYVVLVSPAPVTLGALAGGIARLIRHRWRIKKIAMMTDEVSETL